MRIWRTRPQVPALPGGKSITFSLIVDHRAVDDAAAVRFLAMRASYLSKPTALS